MESIRLDGTAYRVHVEYESLVESFEIAEGQNAGTSITSRQIRDILGTAYSYTLNVERDPRYPEDFDRFYDAISAPVDSHTVVMPHGQENLTFDAVVTSGQVTYGGILGNRRYWRKLTVNFKPVEPQRTT